MSLREEILLDKLKSDLRIENAKVIALQKDIASDEVSVMVKGVLLAQCNYAIVEIKKMISDLEK